MSEDTQKLRAERTAEGTLILFLDDEPIGLARAEQRLQLFHAIHHYDRYPTIGSETWEDLSQINASTISELLDAVAETLNDSKRAGDLIFEVVPF